jgi:hypothetical protein
MAMQNQAGGFPFCKSGIISSVPAAALACNSDERETTYCPVVETQIKSSTAVLWRLGVPMPRVFEGVGAFDAERHAICSASV